MDELLLRLRDPGFWRRVNPQLTVDAPAPAAGARPLPAEPVDGRLVLPALLPAPLVAALRAAIVRLAALHLPPVFVFVYDQPWEIVARAAPSLEAQLGGPVAAGPRLWANPGGPAAAPRPDRPPPWLRARAAPQSLTLWAPLVDGDVVGFTHDTLRWGGRAASPAPSRLGGIACDVTRAPSASPSPAPPFAARLALVGGQILDARQTLAVPERLAHVARALHIT